MSSGRVATAVAAYVAAAAELAALDCDGFTHRELLELLGELEAVTWRMPTLQHRVIARLQREASPVELGAKSLKAVLTERLRISGKDAARRLAEAKELGPRRILHRGTVGTAARRDRRRPGRGLDRPRARGDHPLLHRQAARLGGPDHPGASRDHPGATSRR